MRKRAAFILLIVPGLFGAPKFYNDDPLLREPDPLPVTQAQPRKISDAYDLFSHIFATPGEKQSKAQTIPARDVNTLGEVLEGSWYEMRHYRNPMSIASLQAGPGISNPPADGEWTVISAKNEGVTPGFLIQDKRGVRYFIKFDPIANREIATSSDVVSSKIFYALGYHVPENYIVRFDRSRLRLKPDATFRDIRGIKRSLTWKDVDEILLRTPVYIGGQRRATASLLIQGEILHPYRYFGTRSDDPNDTVSHEHRRSLRGPPCLCCLAES